MATNELEGRVALVTGAASPRGLGRAMTQALVRAGAHVSMLDVRADWLDEAADVMRAIGGPDCVMTQVVDVGDAEDAARSVEATIESLGGLHVLINNAGIAGSKMLGGRTSNNFWDIPVAEWDRVFSVNADGPFYMARAAIPHMIEQGWGRIIGVTTSMGTMYGAGRAPYGPSKSSHEALVAMASRELRDTGVTANVLVPGGLTNTDLIPDGGPFAREDMIQPQIMEAPLLWLASTASDDVTGRRFIAYHWDPERPLEERLAASSAPAAWPQLDSHAITPDRGG